MSKLILLAVIVFSSTLLLDGLPIQDEEHVEVKKVHGNSYLNMIYNGAKNLKAKITGNKYVKMVIKGGKKIKKGAVKKIKYVVRKVKAGGKKALSLVKVKTTKHIVKTGGSHSMAMGMSYINGKRVRWEYGPHEKQGWGWIWINGKKRKFTIGKGKNSAWGYFKKGEKKIKFKLMGVEEMKKYGGADWYKKMMKEAALYENYGYDGGFDNEFGGLGGDSENTGGFKQSFGTSFKSTKNGFSSGMSGGMSFSSSSD